MLLGSRAQLVLCIINSSRRKFGNKGISGYQVGYAGGQVSNPSYRQVCSGTTSHVEVLTIELAPDTATPELFEHLMQFFFMFHDPTTLNAQGNDSGTQYASVIFCSDEQQKQIATKVMAELQQAVTDKKVTTYVKTKIETGIVDYTDFYEAHAEHQEYLMKNPNGYCNHRFRFKEWPQV